MKSNAYISGYGRKLDQTVAKEETKMDAFKNRLKGSADPNISKGIGGQRGSLGNEATEERPSHESVSTMEYDKNIMSNLLGGQRPKGWAADWEWTGEKDEAESTIPKQKSAKWRMPPSHTANDMAFKDSYWMKEDWWNEDPTYLAYNIKMDRGSSPLWNYQEDDIDIYSTSVDDQPEQLDKPGSALSFIESYSEIGEMAVRAKLLSEFQKYITRIFPLNTPRQFDRAAHYIENISGLDKLNSKMTKYGEDKLTITLSEDVGLSSTYIAELYNNLRYSYKYQKTMIPDNNLRFDLMISMSDARIFRDVVNKEIITEEGEAPGTWKEKKIERRAVVNDNPPKIIYTLHDCNFDFEKSMPFPQLMSVGGVEGTSKTQAKLIFEIKYKSISKNFKSEKLLNSIEMHNKMDVLGVYYPSMVDDIGRNVFYREEIYNHSEVNLGDEDIKMEDPENQEPDAVDSRTDKEKRKDERKQKRRDRLEATKQNAKDFGSGVVNSAKQTAENSVNAYKDKLVNKFNMLRGDLINSALAGIRESIGMEAIYPSNVYTADFRTLSIDNFARGLLNDVGNDVLNNLGGAAGTAGNGLVGGNINF